MKRFLLFCFLTGGLFSLATRAQKIDYYYDKAGNRTDRVIRLVKSVKSAKKGASSNKESSSPIEDFVAEQKVLIFPNPTEGALSVAVEGQDSEINGDIIIVNMTGAVIVRKKLRSSLVHFDLSTRPSGIYFMRIVINDKTQTWKIIKK